MYNYCFLQVCDLKEDQYFCLDCAVKYLKTRKAPQRKHCKLLFTHSKEEISTLIKEVNDRIDDSDEETDPALVLVKHFTGSLGLLAGCWLMGWVVREEIVQ